MPENLGAALRFYFADEADPLANTNPIVYEGGRWNELNDAVTTTTGALSRLYETFLNWGRNVNGMLPPESTPTAPAEEAAFRKNVVTEDVVERLGLKKKFGPAFEYFFLIEPDHPYNDF